MYGIIALNNFKIYRLDKLLTKKLKVNQIIIFSAIFLDFICKNRSSSII
jgi:hypothetical protein